jgi:glycosyltransferase involved in cell wall biosynthesis
LRAAEAERTHTALVVPAERDGFEEIGEYGRIYQVRAPRAPLNPSYRLLMPHRYATRSTRIAQILRREQPDLVEISEKYSLPYLAGLLRRGWLPGYRRRPTVIGLSCERMDDNVAAYFHAGRRARAWTRAYMKWLYFPMCDHHIAVSQYVAEELAAASRGHAQMRGVWIRPHGVDSDLFRPGLRSVETRRQLLQCVKGGPDSVLLLYCGRLAPEKNVELLIDLMGHLAARERDFRLVIAGDGILRESLMAEAEERAPGKVVCLGFEADRAALATLFANCDIFIHPNPREPFGIAPLEAMAAGLPVVAPDSGGVTTYADCANAWLGPADGRSFAAAVLEISSDPASAGRRAEAARRTAEQYSWPAITSGYLKLYRDLDRLTRGEIKIPAEPPAFHSTPGNRFGLELRPA